MKTQLWWIEKNGKLATFGRTLDRGRFNTVFESGPPNPFIRKRDAAEHCTNGENPVKVKIVKI